RRFGLARGLERALGMADIVDGHRRPLGGEADRNRPANASGAAGDEREPALEPALREGHGLAFPSLVVARPRALIWDAGAGNISLPKRFGTGNCNDFRRGFKAVDGTAMSALRALADSLGLSPTTVSRALDGYGDVA